MKASFSKIRVAVFQVYERKIRKRNQEKAQTLWQANLNLKSDKKRKYL